jgi:hypothetical protein
MRGLGPFLCPPPAFMPRYGALRLHSSTSIMLLNAIT